MSREEENVEMLAKYQPRVRRALLRLLGGVARQVGVGACSRARVGRESSQRECYVVNSAAQRKGAHFC